MMVRKVQSQAVLENEEERLTDLARTDKLLMPRISLLGWLVWSSLY
jgi:hypothetical protein